VKKVGLEASLGIMDKREQIEQFRLNGFDKSVYIQFINASTRDCENCLMYEEGWCNLCHGSLGPPESTSKWHLDQFSRFCIGLTIMTDVQTDQQTTLFHL